MFKVTDFTYGGISSTAIGLKIVNFNGGGSDTDNVGLPREIEQQKIKRNDIPFFYGVEITPPLTFKLQLAYLPEGETSQTGITPQTMGRISKWLFKNEYQELKVMDTEYTNIVYNCMLLNPKKIQVGNVPYGIEVDVVCDRPYGFYRKEISKTVVNNSSFIIRNEGFSNSILKPEIEFTTGSTTTQMLIQNSTANKQMIFQNLNPNETIYVNCKTQQIISSLGVNRSNTNNFNFVWFELTPDYNNQINVVGSGAVKFRFEFPRPF